MTTARTELSPKEVLDQDIKQLIHYYLSTAYDATVGLEMGIQDYNSKLITK